MTFWAVVARRAAARALADRAGARGAPSRAGAPRLSVRGRERAR
jgi:hypothetical protein